MIENLRPYTEYKESGLPWLGEVPEHWQKERAKRLFRKMNRPVRDDDEVITCFRDGRVTLRKNRRLSGYTEATTFIGYQGIRKGDLVIHGMDAFAGAIGVSDSDGKGTPVYNVCKPNNGVVASYYAYLVREMSNSLWILALAKGIRERSTDFRYETFGNQIVPLPPPAEQTAIVRFLDWANHRLERAIRAKRKVIALLNEQKQAIIHRAVTRGLDPNVRLKDSGIPWLGEIPEHWEVRKLKSLFLIQGSGTTPNDEKYFGGSHNWVMSGDLNDSELRNTKRSVNNKAIEVYSSLKVYPKGSLIVAMYGATIGKTGILGVQACTNQACCVFANPKENVSTRFLQLIMISAKSYLVSKGYGGGQPNINADVVSSLRIGLPSFEEQSLILQTVDLSTSKVNIAISRLEREITLLREYRTRLISDVVTGKLDVREAAARLPEEVPLETETDTDDTDPGEEEDIPQEDNDL